MKRWDTSDLPGHVFSDPFEQPISRREALRRGGVAAAALGTASMFNTAVALGATGPQPRPIPGGFDATFTPVPSNPAFHVLPPTIGFEMSTITDFHGVLAASETQGRARGSDGRSYTFDADMRFMRGTYVGMDGHAREGTFGFI